MSDSEEGIETGGDPGDVGGGGDRKRRAVNIFAASQVAGAGASLRTRSVAKLFVRRVSPNYAEPWKVDGERTAAGTAFLVEGRRVLTNAHVVHRASSILLRAQVGGPKQFPATVLCVGLPCDLALLAVADESFWVGKELLPLIDALPHLDDNVSAVGFPMGGDNVSMTRGVVSRIDVGHNGMLRVQIDAAINPGNSGGPVFSESGAVVGIASSHLKNAANIGYIIPTCVVLLFLRQYERHGRFLGISSLGVGRVQVLESPVLRRSMGLGEGTSAGVRICAVDPLGSSQGILYPDDVILAVDGTSVGQDATVPLRSEGHERIDMLYLLTRKSPGENAELSILRQTVGGGSAEHNVAVCLKHDRWMCPRIDGWDCTPSYFVCGGLVFVPLSYPWAQRRKQTHLLTRHDRPLPAEEQQVVVLSRVLAHEVNHGYHSMPCRTVGRFNGCRPRNLVELADAVERVLDDQRAGAVLCFELQRDEAEAAGHTKVCLDAAACRAAEPEIFRQHLIASRCSTDVAHELRRLRESGAVAGAAPSAEGGGGSAAGS